MSIEIKIIPVSMEPNQGQKFCQLEEKKIGLKKNLKQN